MKLTPDEKVAAAEAQLAEAKEAAAKHHAKNVKLGPVRAFAVELHELLCRDNHDDRCDWYYRNDFDEATWTDFHSSHQRYEERAKNLLAVTDKDTAIAVLKAGVR